MSFSFDNDKCQTDIPGLIMKFKYFLCSSSFVYFASMSFEKKVILETEHTPTQAPTV